MNSSNDTKLHCPSIIIQDVESQKRKSHKNGHNAVGILNLLAQAEADIRNEKVKPQQDVFKEIENALKARMR
jgi:hypothetical protein